MNAPPTTENKLAGSNEDIKLRSQPEQSRHCDFQAFPWPVQTSWSESDVPNSPRSERPSGSTLPRRSFSASADSLFSDSLSTSNFNNLPGTRICWYPLCALHLHCRLASAPGTTLSHGQLLVVSRLGHSPRPHSTANSYHLYMLKDSPKDSPGFPWLRSDTIPTRARLRQARNPSQIARQVRRPMLKTKNRTVCAASKNPHTRLHSPANRAGIARHIGCPSMGITRERS